MQCQCPPGTGDGVIGALWQPVPRLALVWGNAAFHQPPAAFGQGRREPQVRGGSATLRTLLGAGPTATGTLTRARAAGEGPGSPACLPRWRARELCMTVLYRFPCSYLKPDEDKKSKHKTAVKKKTLNPEFNEVGFARRDSHLGAFLSPQT